jgi:serine/threonine protein kinase
VNSAQKIDPDSYVPRTLASEISRRGKLPEFEVIQIALRLAAALEHLHRHQLVHRDIKPSNIIFVNGVPKFADIGLVTDLRGGAKDATYLGTAGYIPPEGPGTVAADVYGLGKVLYELATGLDRERFPELPTNLSGREEAMASFFELNRVILKACETDIRNRYPSAAAVCAALEALQPAVT